MLPPTVTVWWPEQSPCPALPQGPGGHRKCRDTERRAGHGGDTKSVVCRDEHGDAARGGTLRTKGLGTQDEHKDTEHVGTVSL